MPCKIKHSATIAGYFGRKTSAEAAAKRYRKLGFGARVKKVSNDTMKKKYATYIWLRK